MKAMTSAERVPADPTYPATASSYRRSGQPTTSSHNGRLLRPSQIPLGENHALRRKATPTVHTTHGAVAPETVHAALRGPAQSLDGPTRDAMEERFGQDFSHVRVHADPLAAESARTVQAQAYTVANDIVFAPGRYAPSTSWGRRLIAHELTHVTQQAGAGLSPSANSILIDDSREAEAEAAADDVMSARPVRVISIPAPNLQRQVDPTSVTAVSTATREAPTPAPRLAPQPTPVGPDQSAQAQGAEQPAQTGPAARAPLNIEFHCFIPGALGRPFNSFPHAKDLKNQAAFDAAVAAVTTPNSWKPEPMKTEDDVKDPGSARNVWFYSTDERTFGGGSHRLGFKGSVPAAGVGSLAGSGDIFTHWCDASHRVRSTDTGYFTSKGETGKVDGPTAKTATASHSETRKDSGSSSTVETKGSAAYAFMPHLSPDIDYKLNLTFTRNAGGGVDVSAVIEHNLFPFYEFIVNGKILWTFSSKDKNPNLKNLNTSTTEHAPPATF